MEVSSKKF